MSKRARVPKTNVGRLAALRAMDKQIESLRLEEALIRASLEQPTQEKQ